MNVYETKNECIDSSQNIFKTISYKDVISAFAIFGFGCILALGYLLVEYIKKIASYNKNIEQIEDLNDGDCDRS